MEGSKRRGLGKLGKVGRRAGRKLGITSSLGVTIRAGLVTGALRTECESCTPRERRPVTLPSLGGGVGRAGVVSTVSRREVGWKKVPAWCRT